MMSVCILKMSLPQIPGKLTKLELPLEVLRGRVQFSHLNTSSLYRSEKRQFWFWRLVDVSLAFSKPTQ